MEDKPLSPAALQQVTSAVLAAIAQNGSDGCTSPAATSRAVALPMPTPESRPLEEEADDEPVQKKGRTHGPTISDLFRKQCDAQTAMPAVFDLASDPEGGRTMLEACGPAGKKVLISQDDSPSQVLREKKWL